MHRDHAPHGRRAFHLYDRRVWHGRGLYDHRAYRLYDHRVWHSVIFMIIVAVVACIWLLSYRLHVFAGRVFKKVFIGLELERHMLGEEHILTSFFNIHRKKGGFLVVVEVQNICRILSN